MVDESANNLLKHINSVKHIKKGCECVKKWLPDLLSGYNARQVCKNWRACEKSEQRFYYNQKGNVKENKLAMVG
ncbi:MAG: hypothetical protein PHU14_12450 [Methylovulum sp.]|nr:hypothetical protein [Methylovulum sp.]